MLVRKYNFREEGEIAYSGVSVFEGIEHYRESKALDYLFSYFV